METYRPAYPQRGVKFRVHRERDIGPGCVFDLCDPCTTALFEVECVTTKEEAVACVIERLAGKSVCVRQLLPRPAPQAKSPQTASIES